MAKVLVADLVLDYEVYPRVKLSSMYVGDLARALESGTVLPPIIACRTSKRVVDGFHRVKAYLRVFGNTAKIAVKWKNYETEADLFSDAIKLNGDHGRRLSKVDYVRCVQIAERHGIELEEVAPFVGLTEERLDKIVADRTGYVITIGKDGEEIRSPVILPPDCTDKAGSHLSAQQAAAARRGGSNKATFYANRLAELLEADILDLTRGNLRSALVRLREVLDETDLEEKSLAIAA